LPQNDWAIEKVQMLMRFIY